MAISLPHRSDPPPILYHYTSPAGLLGIIRSKQIWASDVHYLNDAQEFALAAGLVVEEVERLTAEHRSPQERLILTSLTTLLPHVARYHVCACSFSEHGDLLSQWRGYCPKGSGYAMGFDSAALAFALGQNGCRLVPCIYDEDEQRRIIRGIIDEGLREAAAYAAAHPDLRTLPGEIVMEPVERFLAVAPVIKHPSFAEEREWRGVTEPMSKPKMSWRPGASLLVPYVALPLAGQAQRLPLREVVVGPTPHSELAQYSVGSLLSTCDADKWEVRGTRIPYRDW